VLPPWLPGKRGTEAQAQEVQEDLLSRVLDALTKLKDITDAETTVVWESIERTSKSCREVNADGWVNEAPLLDALKELKPDNAIVVYVACQNARLLIRQLS
jgi:hypothetical protein